MSTNTMRRKATKNELIIHPIKTVDGGEFSEQILTELIKEGL